MSTTSSVATPMSTSPVDHHALSTPATSVLGDLEHPPYSIATLSLGTNVHHSLPKKIRIASRLGYDSIELFIPDFDAFVHEVGVGAHSEMFTEADWAGVSDVKDVETMCARAIGRYCETYGLFISCFQPFREFENFQGASRIMRKSGSIHPRLRVALDRAESYLRIMPEMKCDLLLVCSNFLPVDPMSSTTREEYAEDQIVAFTELGNLAQRYGVKIGHEALAWGTAVNRWDQVWDIVERVDLPNVGIILDSFNQLGQQWADPSEPSGRRPLPDSTLTDNLHSLSIRIPADKIFLYQIADAALPSSPILPHPSFPSRMAWSRKMRLFPMESEGYLPVQEFTKTLMRMGYKGVWSLEVFNASLDSMKEDTVQTHGQRGIDGLKKLHEAVSR